MPEVRSVESGSTSLGEMERKLKESQVVRRTFEPQWYLNLSYYLGRQWVRWTAGRLEEPNLGNDFLRVTDNRVRPLIRTEMAKMTKERPVWTVSPRSADEADLKGALASEQIAAYCWDNYQQSQVVRAALLWARICTAGFVKSSWDRDAGEGFDVFANEENQPYLDESERPVRALRGMEPPEGYERRRVARGDLLVEVRTPFEIYVDPLAGEDGLRSAEWVIEKTVQRPESVAERYGATLEPDSDAIAGVAESRFPGIGTSAASDSVKGRGVTVCEYWQRPSTRFPDGRRVVWAGKTVLYDDVNPYPHLPYAMFRGSPVPGRFWPASPVDDWISPQTELNKRESQISENALRIGNPPLMESRQAEIDWDGLPGDRLRFNETGTGYYPRFLQSPELPVYLVNDLGRIENSLREISGQHEVTQGTVPAGVTAASAINLLQEQDDTRLAPDILDMELAIGEMGRQQLWILAEFATDKRTMRILGDEGEWDIKSWRGSAMNQNFDLVVQAGSQFPRSKAAKQAAMTEILNLMIQYGVKVSERDLRKFFGDYEVGGLERLFSSVSQSEGQCQRENRDLVQGRPRDINSYDDDDFHITAHDEFRRTREFELAPDPVKGLFEDHVKAHRERRAKIEAAATAPPAPGEQIPSELEGLVTPNGEGPSEPLPSPEQTGLFP